MEKYTLYSVRKEDVDIALYRLVETLMACKYGTAVSDKFDTASVVMAQQLKEGSYGTNYHHFLVFPSEDLTVEYSLEMLQQEAVILKVGQREQTVPGNPFLDDDDEVVVYVDLPTMFSYVEQNVGTCTLRQETCRLPFVTPKFFYNGPQFAFTLGQLIHFLAKNGMAQHPWHERLTMARQMLDADANELHILHNAGLFDHKTLWPFLKKQGISAGEVDSIAQQYVSQLKIYAMFVINKFNWSKGNLVYENEKSECRGFFSDETGLYKEKMQKEAIRRENLRRLRSNDSIEKGGSNQSQPQSSQIEITPTSSEESNQTGDKVLSRTKQAQTDNSTPSLSEVGKIASPTHPNSKQPCTDSGREAQESVYSAEFRYSMAVVGCLFPFIWGILAVQIGRVCADRFSYEAQLVFVAILSVLLIVAAYVIMPPKDKNRYRQRCIAVIVIATSMLIGQFGGSVFLIVNG